MKIKNWAGNYEYNARNVLYPTTIEQIQSLVKQHKKIRVIGTRHSFNGIADSPDTLISLEQYPSSISIHHEQTKVSFGASVTYAELSRTLHAEGLALPNLASLPHISVVGACATATHGSGDGNQNLAASVSGLEFVTADGELVRLSREQYPEFFEGVIVHLGGLGVIVGLTLDVLPAFEITQVVYEHLLLAQLETYFDEIMSSAYSVSLFTDWRGDHINQVWLKDRSGGRASFSHTSDFYGATPATHQKHPIAGFSAEACTDQLGIPGAWHERLPHFRMDAVPSAGNELQSEYFVPRDHAIKAIQAVGTLRSQIAPHLLVSEIRSIAADTLWMSPCYQQDAVAIHFTWKPDWPAVSQLLPLLEAQLAAFDARPHWGKLFSMTPHRIQAFYPKLPQFRELLQHYDPQGKFRNSFLEAILWGE